MLLDDEFLRASYYCVNEIIHSRRRTGAPIPAWMRRHYNQLDNQIKALAPRGALVVENAGGVPQSQHAHGVIGSRQAGEMMGIPAREVRRHAEEWGGAFIAGRWLFSADNVVNYMRRD
jgi:hypothetical protein